MSNHHIHVRPDDSNPPRVDGSDVLFFVFADERLYVIRSGAPGTGRLGSDQCTPGGRAALDYVIGMSGPYRDRYGHLFQEAEANRSAT